MFTFQGGQKIVLNNRCMAELKRQRDLICKGFRLLGRDASIFLNERPLCTGHQYLLSGSYLTASLHVGIAKCWNSQRSICKSIRFQNCLDFSQRNLLCPVYLTLATRSGRTPWTSLLRLANMKVFGSRWIICQCYPRRLWPQSPSGAGRM